MAIEYRNMLLELRPIVRKYLEYAYISTSEEIYEETFFSYDDSLLNYVKNNEKNKFNDDYSEIVYNFIYDNFYEMEAEDLFEASIKAICNTASLWNIINNRHYDDEHGLDGIKKELFEYIHEQLTNNFDEILERYKKQKRESESIEYICKAADDKSFRDAGLKTPDEEFSNNDWGF